MSTQKRCPRCREERPVAAFGPNKTRVDGLQPICKRCGAERHRLRRYEQLEPGQYQEMYDKLKGKCPLCGVHREQLCVDHDHDTNEIRGLLCVACNRVVGYLDNHEWLARAMEYLGR